MIKASLLQRLTFQYTHGWRSLDEERYLGQMVVTPRRQVSLGDSYGDGAVYLQHVRVPAGLKGRVASAAIANTMSRSCRHEWDCCGCANLHVQVRQLGARDFLARTTVSRNI
jgi:hypothetical protein